jgi:hypothetical protein
MSHASQSLHLIRMEGRRRRMKWKNVFESTSRRQRRKAAKASLGALLLMGASLFMGWQLLGLARALGGNRPAAQASVSAGLIGVLFLALAAESFRRRTAWVWASTAEPAVERWLLGLPYTYEAIALLGLIQSLLAMVAWVWLPAAAAGGAPYSLGASNLLAVGMLAVSAVLLGSAVGDSAVRHSRRARIAAPALWLLLWGFLVWQIAITVASPERASRPLGRLALILFDTSSLGRTVLLATATGLVLGFGFLTFRERIRLMAWRASGAREPVHALPPYATRAAGPIAARGPVSTLLLRECRATWAWMKREPAAVGATCLVALIPLLMLPADRAPSQMPLLIAAWLAFLPALMVAEASGRSLTTPIRARLRTSLARPWLGNAVSLAVATMCSCMVAIGLVGILAFRWSNTVVTGSIILVVVVTCVVSTVLNRVGYSLTGLLNLPEMLGRLLRLGTCVLVTFSLALLLATSGAGYFVVASLIAGLVGVLLIDALESRMELPAYDQSG